jgi:hypothetical protein
VEKDAEDITEFEIDKFFEQVDLNLERVNVHFDTIFMPIIKNNLIELCKQIKRKLQRDGDHNKENNKAKPLIHIEQENHLRTIIRHFANMDDKMLLDFMRMIQNMMRGMIYNN